MGEILEKRLQKEAERRSLGIDEARIRMLELGLDAAKERRDRAVKAPKRKK